MRFFPVFSLVALATGPLRAGDPPPLAGSWVINAESESEHQQFSRGQGGGGRRPGGRPPEREGGSGQEISRALRGGDRGLGELLRPKLRLTISQTDTLITVTDDAGWSRELIPTGQHMREELGQGGPAEVETHWKGGKLIAERQLDLGGTYRETYARDLKKGRLIVEIHYKTSRMPSAIEARRVYDLEPASP